MGKSVSPRDEPRLRFLTSSPARRPRRELFVLQNELREGLKIGRDMSSLAQIVASTAAILVTGTSNDRSIPKISVSTQSQETAFQVIESFGGRYQLLVHIATS